MSNEGTHNHSDGKVKATITTSNGAPVSSLTASMTAGSRGPILLQDFTLLDHLAHFDRERIPERVVHAKGAGAFGYFECTNSDFMKSVCKAKMFEFNGKRVPVAVRCKFAACTIYDILSTMIRSRFFHMIVY